MNNKPTEPLTALDLLRSCYNLGVDPETATRMCLVLFGREETALGVDALEAEALELMKGEKK